MIKKPIPIKLSSDANEKIQSQLNVQSTSRAVPKSTDPKNFPVFDIPTGKKVLIYVPNHVIDGADGPELRMDKPLIHAVQDGKRFVYYRCVSGIMYDDENGNTLFDGSCPLCEGTSIPWDLANRRIQQKCAQAGLNPEDKENTQVKAIRSGEFSARVLKESNRYFTFPIVVIDTVNDDGKTIQKGEDGKPICTTMWYHISEAQYNRKWVACFEGIEDEPTHPGGRFFTLNFIYDTKNKEPNKRDAAQNLTVIARNINKSEEFRAYLDNKTKDWTPEKAQETVITNQLFSIEDLQRVADDVLAPSKEMLSLLELADSGIQGNTSDGFSLKAPTDTKAIPNTTGVTAMDETDSDVDFDLNA